MAATEPPAPGAMPELVIALKNLESALADCQRALHPPADTTGPLFDALRQWRTAKARAKQVPPYIIASDAALRAIEKERPTGLPELQVVRGLGAKRALDYGAEILQIVASVPDPGTA